MADSTLEVGDAVRDAVRLGLQCDHKSLPAWLFYDAEGSRLYEQITVLPEYYLTRAERAIFALQSGEIVARVCGGSVAPLTVLELGAGAATKTQLLLHAVVARQGHCHYYPADVSPTALESAASRLREQEPGLVVTPVQGYHEQACEVLAGIPALQLALFIGSSIGNFETDQAIALLRRIRASLRSGGALLLGADLAKSPDVLIPAYDDAQGVTAAFNLNLLSRLNRELDGDFDLSAFAHVALWNAADSRIEMHLESLKAQDVHLRAMDVTLHFRQGERIHTESSVKYTIESVRSILGAAGFTLEHTFFDPDHLFGLHLARA